MTAKSKPVEIVLENGVRIVVLADFKSSCSIMIETPSKRSETTRPQLRVDITRPAVETKQQAAISIRTCNIPPGGTELNCFMGVPKERR